MVGVAAVVNSAIPNEESIQLYFNNNNLNLSVIMMSGKTGEDPKNTIRSEDTAHKGIIPNPSVLAAANVNGTNVVVGLTLPTDESKMVDVSVVSPAYQPLNQIPKTNVSAIAVCSVPGGTPNDPKDAWAFYLKGVDKATAKLGQTNLVNGTEIKDVDSAPTTSLTTQIAAYYNADNRKRYVVFQDEEGALQEWNAFEGGVNPIKNAAGCAKNSTLAVTYYNKKAYLYYIDNVSGQPRRVIKKGDKWGGSELIDEDAISPSSQMTVTTANKTNHLFYLTQTSGSKFNHVRDPVDE